MNLPHNHYQAFYDLLTQIKALYNIYMTQGKRYSDALHLFSVNSQFLEFATQILKEVDSNAIDYSDLDSLANYLASWKKQFSRHEPSHSFKINDVFTLVREFDSPFQSVDNFLKR